LAEYVASFFRVEELAKQQVTSRAQPLDLEDVANIFSETSVHFQ
jgi:hypothetical protein